VSAELHQDYAAGKGKQQLKWILLNLGMWY